MSKIKYTPIFNIFHFIALMMGLGSVPFVCIYGFESALDLYLQIWVGAFVIDIILFGICMAKNEEPTFWGEA